ncbi:CHAT domain-containing protein [Streptomyces sp. Tu 3180]|uniref:CHAT domain-containing protein n=1 Tax=Streptomyces sp. Tu 3180 TaxID=2682611 RepID=UPI00135CACFE|nr:CHAT domain-containing protein [Streptomyces sp. Tu 3180]KAF3464068.1 CHAT domain-containing protein [Streptomyces sp. Tu 3180]
MDEDDVEALLILQDALALEDLSDAVLPKAVRRHLSREMTLLADGQKVRLRVRLLTGPEDTVRLAALPLERVCVPEAHAVDATEAWQNWVEHGHGVVGVPKTSLREHPHISLVREVLPRRTMPSAVVEGLNDVIVVAGAASVQGEITTRPGTTRHVAGPGPLTYGSEDRDRIVAVLDGSRFRTRPLDPAPADTAAIHRDLAGGPLAFYFGGHHVDGGLVVAREPGSRAAHWLDGDTLAAWLVDEMVPLAVLMACDSASPAPDDEGRHEASLAERLALAGVPYVVAVDGKVRDGQAGDFAGRFFAALVNGVDVDLAVLEGAKAFEGTSVHPVLFTSRAGAPLRLGTPAPREAASMSSAAHRVPTGVADRIDERFRVCLKAELCLRESAFTSVLADPSGDNLADLLNRTEQELWRTRVERKEPLDGKRLLWYTYGSPRNLPDLTPESLRLALSPAYVPERPMGLVIRRPASFPAGLDWTGHVRELRRLLPGLRGVVLQVHNGSLPATRRTAQRIAEELGEGEYLVRALEHPDASDPDLFGAALAEALRATGTTPPTGLSDASTVIAYLNGAGSPWGDLTAEAGVLRAVRARQPDIGDELLRAHAVDRSDPARWASLWATEGDDAATRAWLRTAHRAGRLPRPEAFRGVALTPTMVDTVVLGLLHTGLHTDDAFRAWLEEQQPSDAVTAAARVAARGEEPVVRAQDLASPEHAVALDRAGLLSGSDFTELDPLGQRLGSWTLLMRLPLSTSRMTWVLDRSPARRSLVGLASKFPSGVPDYDLQDELHDLRGALRPSLFIPPRGPGLDHRPRARLRRPTVRPCADMG